MRSIVSVQRFILFLEVPSGRIGVVEFLHSGTFSSSHEKALELVPFRLLFQLVVFEYIFGVEGKHFLPREHVLLSRLFPMVAEKRVSPFADTLTLGDELQIVSQNPSVVGAVFWRLMIEVFYHFIKINFLNQI